MWNQCIGQTVEDKLLKEGEDGAVRDIKTTAAPGAECSSRHRSLLWGHRERPGSEPLREAKAGWARPRDRDRAGIAFISWSNTQKERLEFHLPLSMPHFPFLRLCSYFCQFLTYDFEDPRAASQNNAFPSIALNLQSGQPTVIAFSAQSSRGRTRRAGPSIPKEEKREPPEVKVTLSHFLQLPS